MSCRLFSIYAKYDPVLVSSTIVNKVFGVTVELGQS